MHSKQNKTGERAINLKTRMLMATLGTEVQVKIYIGEV